MKRVDIILVPVLAFAIFGWISHTLFLFEQSVPSWILMASFGMAVLFLTRFCRRKEPPNETRAPSPILWGGAIILLGLWVWSAWTSYVTPDRSWDGVVSWSLRARALGSPADLSNAFFSEPLVFAHSRAYPLLQPLIIASLADVAGDQAARLFFPFLYLSIILLLFQTTRRMGASHAWGLVIAVAAALTPAYMDVGAGAIDSGYGDLFLAYVLAVGAAGLLLEDSLYLFLACLLLPWIKPEGVVYALIFFAVLAFAGNKRRLLASSAGMGLSLFVWLPLRARLSFSPESILFLVVPVAMGGLVLLALGLQRMRSTKTRMLALTVLASIAIVVGMLGRSWLASSDDLALRIFATNLDRVPDRLPDLPALLLGFVTVLFTAKTLGLVFLLLGLTFVFPLVRDSRGGRSLKWFLCASFIMFLVAILLSPEQNLAHEVRSRLTRLVLQVVPAAWIFLAQVGGSASKNPCIDSENQVSREGCVG